MKHAQSYEAWLRAASESAKVLIDAGGPGLMEIRDALVREIIQLYQHEEVRSLAKLASKLRMNRSTLRDHLRLIPGGGR